MDLNQIKTILQDNTDNGTLTLPPGALESIPIAEAFRDYLLDADLIVNQVNIVEYPGQNITVVGQGGSFPFENTYVTAVFTVRNNVAAMTIDADGFFSQTTVWNFSSAFPILEDTFYKDLKFAAAVLTLRSSNASLTEPGGLFFDGKQELAGTLAVISKLLNGSTEVEVKGPIVFEGEKTPETVVPVMVLADPVPGSALGMEFIYQLLDGFRIAVKRPPQVGTTTKPVPQMQLVSRITVDSEQGRESVDIAAHFTEEFSLLTFEADMDQLLFVTQTALNTLARGANLGNVLPSQLPLVNRFKLGQWSMSVIPQVPQISSISIGAGIIEPWPIIPGLFTLQEIDFAFTINYVNEKYEPNASLNAKVKLLEGPAEFTIVVDAQYPSYIVTGFLEEESKIDLIALVRWILGDRIAGSLPCTELKVTVMTLLIDPRNSTFTFETVITAHCSFNLGLVIFTLTQVNFNFNYVAGEATGSFGAAFWLVPPGAVPPDTWSIDDPPPGAVAMEVSAAYNGAEDGWSFRGGLAEKGKIDLPTIIGIYLPPSYQQFIPNVVITQLEAGFETGVSKAYDFAIGAEWRIELLSVTIGALVKISSRLEDDKRKDEGEIQGFLRFGGKDDEGGLEFKVTAKFNDEAKEYIFEFLGWTATLKESAEKKTLTFEAGDKSLGEMIEVLINAVYPGEDIKLVAPWNVLNSVPLKSFKFIVEFSPEDSSPKTASLSYSPNINLGFARIGTLELEYDVKTEKVMFKITEGQFLGNDIKPDDPVKWDVADPDSTPKVPGEGSEVFKLTFLGLGQHMAVFNDETRALEPVPASILGAIGQLTSAFDEEKNLSLVFNEATDWLIGADFEVLQAVKVGIVFYDPELYGVVISVTGSKAGEKLKIFNGLEFEILYKKINDTIGMWQIDLTLPFYIRNLQFGAVSVTLPSMKVQIYTNGDFMIDLGFPANGDFTRSFSVQAFPFVGSGGLYFGKLSSATSDKVPTVTNGSFSPVIAFGIGLRIGLGKDLDYGIVKAGMSVTVQGILEGIFAWYNAYPAQLSSGSPTDTQLVRAGSRQLAPAPSSTLTAAAKDPFYYMIQARVSLVGKIYGSVDLGIIQADLEVEVVVSLRLTLEAYKAIDVFFEVRISLSLRVRINLGLFKITIKLSFKMNMSFNFTIGQTDPNPPWGRSLSQKRFTRQLTALGDEECPEIPEMKWQPLLVNTPVSVPLQFVPQFTAGTDGPLGAGSPRKPYVVAMTYVSSKVEKVESPPPPPFDQIARGALLWTLNAYLNSKKENTTLAELLTQDITIEQLNKIYCYLTQEGMLEPFTEDEVLKFLEKFFKFEVTIPPPAPPPTSAVIVEDDEVSVFPIMPLLKLTTSTGVDVDFFTQTPASAAYLDEVKKYFREMAVRYKSAAEKKDQASFKVMPELENKSLASFIFLDFFAMLARSTVQDAISYLQTQKAPLTESESLAEFINRRTDLGIDVRELALANATRPLRAGVQLRVPGAVYTVKRGDTVQSIAAKVNHDILTLRSANPLLKSALPEPATQIALPGATFITSDHEPESLLDVSRVYGVSLTELIQANADVPELFPAGEPLLAPYAQQENVGRLVEALQANQSFNNLSGLAARVLLQGLRPPSPADSPQAGAPAPLYELTGQQFDGSNLVTDSTVTLNVADTVSRWFQLGGGTRLTYTVTAAAADSLARLKTAPFGPPVTFETAKLLRVEPRRFTLPTAVLWHTPVALVTANRGSERLPETVEPHLWQFPSELMDVITGKQALQPQVRLWTQLQEGPGQTHEPKLITDYSWSTVIEIQVRQTASGDGVFLPNTYEMTGIDSGGGRLLENLLVWYAEAQLPRIDKIQILYPPDPAVPDQEVPPNGLKSDPDPTFFLLQTNLSTASNPPQLSQAMLLKLAAGSPQRDPLGQSDIEFLKLMWESAVVNSGGYVLYYEGKPKQGLPNYLFSQDGIGKLTLLVTYTITDNVLRNFMNNVVVRQAIDTDHEVFYAQPVAQTVSDFTLAPDESLAEVAARYRVTVSQLATQYNNAHAKLAPGKHLRIPPLTYRVRAGESLETIAARANVTTQAIAEANGSSEGSFIRLPETVWRAGAEDSLASLAERFSTTVVTLAHANKDVQGLIAGSIQFDDRLEEAIATIPAGNIAFKFKRPAAVSDDFNFDPQNQLAELYNLLGYRIKAANGFEATNSALPISPETPEAGPDQGRWIYQSVVPVFPFVTQPTDAGQLLPSPKENPYNGVGNTVLVNFNWQDLFGNWLDSSLQDPNWPNKGFPIGYIDNLIPLDQWPAVTSDYVIAQGEASPELIVTLRFNADLYKGPDTDAIAAMALTDLGKFRTIYYQLTQPDVRVTLSSTMQGDVALNTSSPLDVMVQFVLSIINFLTPISVGQPAPPAPAERAMSQPVADENGKNLFALVVRVAITRNLDLVNDEFKDVASVSTVTSRVPANAGQEKAAALKAAEPEPVPPLSLQEFAKRLETAFPRLKVLVAAPKKGLGEVAEEIWIARFAPTSTGIAFNIDGKNPLFFAVEPLAGSLLSREEPVLVYPYQTGRFIGNEIPVKTSQSGVDLDQMGRDFLNAMEQVLGPQFSASTWKLEYESGMPPPDSDPPDPQKYPYEAIVAAKDSLAGAISKHVANVFVDATPADALADAREMMRQQLLVSLTSAYTVDVVMQYPVAVTHSQYPDTDLFAPRLFGKPVSQNPDDPNDVEKKNAYSFSTGRFSLAKTTTRLTFSFDTNREQQGRDGKQFDDVFNIDLFYQINAIEHEIHPVEGIDGYLASSWLTFVLPDSFDKPGERKILVPLGEQTIPVPLRAYPTPPSLSEQTFIPHVKQFVGDDVLLKNDEDKLLEARRWDCSCQYEYVGAAHDKILADIKLNVPVSSGLQAKFSDADDPDLFAALIQFSSAYPDIARDLDRFLATGTDEQNARNAISSFAWLAQRTAKAWHTWQNTNALYSPAPLDSPEYHFVITQRAESVNGVNALVVSVQTTDALGFRLSQLPEIQIEGYKTVPFAPTMDSISYYFISLQDERVLPYESGRNISTRRMVFKDFDILKIENAWAGAAVKRNEDLIQGETTNPAFVFQSPVVRFVNVLTPLLDPDEKIDIADYAAQKPSKLAQYLSDFFIAFFKEAQTVGNENRTIRLGASYGYGLQDSGETAGLMPDLEVTIPILLSMPTSISILRLGPDSSFIKDVSDTIEFWFRTNAPTGLKESGKLWFDFSIYSSLSESQLPVLRMRRLFLATNLLILPT